MLSINNISVTEAKQHYSSVKNVYKATSYFSTPELMVEMFYHQFCDTYQQYGVALVLLEARYNYSYL